MIYEIIYKGKVLERLATKGAAEKIAEMYRRGEVWTLPKILSDVKVVEHSPKPSHC
jgi:hypothetical protein